METLDIRFHLGKEVAVLKGRMHDIDGLVLKPAIYIEPSPNENTEKWSNFFGALKGVPVVSEAPNFA